MATTVSQPNSDITTTLVQHDAPRLECIDRMVKLPVVEAAFAQSMGLYERVKGSHGLVNWTLSTAEGAAKKALDIAVPLATPIAVKFQQPIGVVDQTLCKGLDALESKLPVIKEPPQQIYDGAVHYTLNKVTSATSYGTNKAHSLAELSWNKANEVLTTRYGSLTYNTFDATALIMEKYFDYYFPPSAAEQDEPQGEAVPSEDVNDRVAHTVHTVGRLSNKVARRVYDSVSTQVKSLDKDKVHEYVSSLVALLTLTTYINVLRQTNETMAEEEKKRSS